MSEAPLPRASAGALALLCAILCPLLHAQYAADPFEPVRSIGLPPHFAFYGGISGVGQSDDGFKAGAHAHVGTRHELFRPVIGVLGVALEGYGGIVGERFDGGGRLYGTIRALQFRAGMEVGTPDGWPPRFTMAIEDPIVRGGVAGRGGAVRVEWTPAAHRFNVGLNFPLFQPMVGKSRPRAIALPAPIVAPVTAPAPLADPTMERLLAAVRESALWIDRLTTPFLESSLQTDQEWQAELAAYAEYMFATDAEFPAGHTYPAEVTAYHRRLGRVFARALDLPVEEARSGAVTALARRVLLDEVILPANRHFGMLRGKHVFSALHARASARFATELERTGVDPLRVPALRAAFDGWLEVVWAVERQADDRWNDSRLVWLPFQLALVPEEHDSQDELDDLLERVSDASFEEGNDFEYLINEAFSPELIRSILGARDYHVLWIHDFPGSTAGHVDRVGARVVADGYLAALAQRVREFDITGRLPVFMIFLDQWYFDFRNGRLWMGLLQDPLGPDIELPREERSIQSEVRAAQRSLRDAVATSARLQALARERGERWLRRFVSVHVNITYPGDPSFRRRTPARDIPLLAADDYMRDHRKVVFWDLTERDPSRGGALFTGEGVGEHYEGSSWEDRTLLVRGPATLPVKREARELLLAHGMRESEIPYPLRPHPPSDGWVLPDSLTGRWVTRLLQAHNGTGYLPKYASALKASLYNLMPAGSRLLIPDSQWSSFFWAGMLAGTALRGGHVLVIAPRSANAPYGESMVQTVLTHDVLEGYIQIRSAMAPAFAASGGSLSVGLYGRDAGTRSMQQRYFYVQEGMLAPTFPREDFPFSASTFSRFNDRARLDSLTRPTQAIASAGSDHGSSASAPKLHLKSQLMVSGQALERVLADPGWYDVFFNYITRRVEESTRDPALAAAGRMTPAMLAPVDSVLRQLPAGAREHDVLYLLSGSQNQNDRSLLLDGELLCLVAGPESLASLVDFVGIAAQSTWVENVEALDSLIRRFPRREVKLARSLRSVF